MGSRGSRTLSGGLPLVAALALLLPTALCLPALGQEPPPEDAPPEGFPSGTPSTQEQPPVPLAPRPAAPPNIGGGIWLAEGPGPAIFGQVEAITPGPDEVVGAVHTLAAHPVIPDVLYAGGANGGVWKTDNATAASPMWTPLTDFETSTSIGALEFDPLDLTHQTLVAGIGLYSAFGSSGGTRDGLLKTTDGGATWSPISGGGTLSGSNISGVAPRGMTIVATSNFATPFTCGGSGLIGIWRSTDGGATFGRLASPAGPDGVAFDLASDPASTSTLYTGLTFVPTCTFGALTNGIYKSTDTGATWTKVSSPAMDALIIDDLPPGSPGTNNIEIAVDGSDVYVNIIQSGRPVGIFHSANGGTSWTAMDIPRTPEGAAIVIAPPDLLIPGAPILIDHTPTGLPHGLSTGMEVDVTGVLGTLGANGVWTVSVLTPTIFSLTGSADFTAWVPGSGVWQKVVGLNPKVKPGSQGGIHASIRVDPVTGSTVYLGGDRQDFPFPNFLGALDFSGRLFRGDTTVAPTGAIPSPQWEHLTHSDSVGAIPGGGTASTSAPHADSREMVFDANGDIIEGDDGGIYRRTSPTTNTGDWFSINGNMQVTEQHDIAYDSLSDVIVSGNQDTGTTQQQAPGGNLIWDSIHTADGGDVAVDDSSTPGVSTRYSSFQFLGSFRRRDYDASNGFLSQAFPTLIPLGAVTLLGNFVTPVELNALSPVDLIIGGCNAVVESFDRGDTYTEIPGLSNPGCPGGSSIFPSLQNAMAYGGFKTGGVPHPDAIWVGSGSSVYTRLGGYGTAFSLTPTAFPGTTVTDIVLDPSDTSTAYVTDATGIYQTHDAGTTWTAMTGNLTDTRLGSVVIDPAAGRLFVGGREGVSTIALPTPGVAATGPFAWGQIGTGLPNAPVWDMEWDFADSKLVVGTLGRGAWTLQENGACGAIPDTLTVRNQWIAGTQVDSACTKITAGPALDVQSGGELTLKSPLIELVNGFAVKSGGEFETSHTVP